MASITCRCFITTQNTITDNYGIFRILTDIHVFFFVYILWIIPSGYLTWPWKDPAIFKFHLFRLGPWLNHGKPLVITRLGNPINIPLNHSKIPLNYYKIPLNHSKIPLNHYKIPLNLYKVVIFLTGDLRDTSRSWLYCRGGAETIGKLGEI